MSTTRPSDEAPALGGPAPTTRPDAGQSHPTAGTQPPDGGDIVLGAGQRPLPEYKLMERLGRGSFGEVWKASGPGGFPVALKFIRLGGEADQVELRALELMRGIRHAHLLPMFGAWQRDDLLIIAMELADRTLLRRWEEARAQGLPGIPAAELLEYMREAAKGLDFLNWCRVPGLGGESAGIQHRDIKPENLLLVGGAVKIGDCGLARLLERSFAPVSERMTPLYAAPEFFRNQATRWSDQYCLAATYCQLRGGRVPFEAEHLLALAAKHATEPPDLTMLPEAERLAVARALAKEPKDRWPSCRAFVENLAEAGRPAPVPPPPPSPAPDQGAHDARLAQEGEELLSRLCWETLERTRGKPASADTILLTRLCRRYGIPIERGNAIGRLVHARWREGHSNHRDRGEQAPPPAPRPSPLDCTGPGGLTAAEVRRAQEAWARYLGRDVEETVEVGNGVRMTFVLVPPGKFRMGSRKGEKDRSDDETLHDVTLTEPFDLGKTEITQAQYEALTGENPSHFKGDDLPVETVSWEEAQAYAVQLTKKRSDKHLYRLPTEAEWEYSCRGGRPYSQPFGVGDGRTLSSREANFDGNFPYGGAEKGPRLHTTSRVGSYPANVLGLFDMHGNVWEWCADWYGPYPPGDATNPAGPAQGSSRVRRGGCWNYGARICRAAIRSRNGPGYRIIYVGFRLARTLPPAGK